MLIFPLNTTFYSGVLHIYLVFLTLMELQLYFFLKKVNANIFLLGGCMCKLCWFAGL